MYVLKFIGSYCTAFRLGFTAFLRKRSFQIHMSKVLGWISTSVLGPSTLRLRRASSTFSLVGTSRSTKRLCSIDTRRTLQQVSSWQLIVKWSEVKTSRPRVLTSIVVLRYWIAAICGITRTHADICFTVALGSGLAGWYIQVPHRSTFCQQVTSTRVTRGPQVYMSFLFLFFVISKNGYNIDGF